MGDLAKNLSGINVSGIGRRISAGNEDEGDTYLWPDPKRGIVQGDRLLLARFDSGNVGSSTSTVDVEEVRKKLLIACEKFEMEVAVATNNSRPALSNGSLGANSGGDTPSARERSASTSECMCFAHM